MGSLPDYRTLANEETETSRRSTSLDKGQDESRSDTRQWPEVGAGFRFGTRDTTLLRRVCHSIVLTSVIAWCVSTARAEGMAPIFGPKQYERSTGRPDQFTETFPNCELGARYDLVVRNGKADGTDRVSNASITLNGSVLLGPAAFNQQTGTIRTPIDVRTTNQLAIQLASAPGSELTVSVECNSGCLGIVITAPGIASTAAGALPVAGVLVSSSVDLGVTVNGIAAGVEGTHFLSRSVPLVVGLNTVSAQVTNACQNTASASLQVTRTAPGSQSVGLSGGPLQGLAPFTVAFSAHAVLSSALNSVAWDFDGDGKMDAVGQSSLLAAQTTYTQPGLYTATVTVTDVEGHVLTATLPIVVYAVTALQNTIQSKWNGLVGALHDGNITQALLFIASNQRTTYSRAFTALQPDLATLAGELSLPPQLDSVAGNVASAHFTAVVNGRTTDVLLQLILDSDGLWRIMFF